MAVWIDEEIDEVEQRQKSPSGAGASFLAPWQFGASLRETNGVQRSRCCQSVMVVFSPPGCLARDGQTLSCPIRNGGQRATPTARVPPVGKSVKRRCRAVHSAPPGAHSCFTTGVCVTLNTAIHKRQNNYVPHCRNPPKPAPPSLAAPLHPSTGLMFTNPNQSHPCCYYLTQKWGLIITVIIRKKNPKK